MTPLEAAALCRFTKSVCPQQAIDEYTPDAWHPLLSDLRFEDARDAVILAARLSPFVAPAEIREQVKVIRNGRITAFGPLPVPPRELADDPDAESRWKRDLIRRIADGEPIAEVSPPEIEPSAEHVARLRELLAGSKSIPDEDDTPTGPEPLADA